ncbi:helix-turn-helix domain-containing protein [Tetragenococcus halophilus]|uniref:Helix-turn-helix transcriptional regulator n=1 Tax=Tetragenococcus halophilus TaxID=51669 RepID=A0AB35HLV2_TETHA|nr:helix-turn-helix transcriptional regulator [Tetragenococcus halophilus]MCO8297229.1 helix-turn-helix transcriptional regulator [Tetragenococcus halophilus]
MTIKDSLARNLRIAMADKNIKANKLSKETGISETTISNLRNGKTNGITFETLEKLAEHLGVSVSDLFERR